MSRDVDPQLTRLFDKRTVNRNIKKGLITRKDYDKHLKSLEDLAGKSMYGGLESTQDNLDDDLDDEPEQAGDEGRAPEKS